MSGVTHIIGAGLAGLSAAVNLAGQGRQVIVHEAAGHAGGRCRSYHDAALGLTIDNGNHLLLSGNHAARKYLERIGSGGVFATMGAPVFEFADAKTGERWALRMSKGLLPFWLMDEKRRVPGTRFADYFSILKLLRAKPQQTVAQAMDTDASLFRRLWHTLLLSALNTHPGQGSAQLAAAILRGTLLKGGSACIPWVAEGLSSVFIDPALRYLADHGGEVRFNHRLRRFEFEADRAATLEFANGEVVTLTPSDTVISAIPCWGIAELLPGVSAPDESRAILNAHFHIAPPAGFPRFIGVINATTEWIFCFPDRISVTVSDADRFMQDDREALAQRMWQEVAGMTGLAATLPPWQIVKEKRATFAATPAQEAKRPGAVTKWRNVILAGDWLDTGLPATIEGAIRSGVKAAELAMKQA